VQRLIQYDHYKGGTFGHRESYKGKMILKHEEMTSQERDVEDFSPFTTLRKNKPCSHFDFGYITFRTLK
jgi:hypothetical protein